MARGITTSIRLQPSLHDKLEKMTHTLHRGKNWLISEAVRRYIEQLDNPDLIKEAKRQSLLISKQNNPDADVWEVGSDLKGWTF